MTGAPGRRQWPAMNEPTNTNSLPVEDPSLLFEHAPISLWVQDFSGIRRLFDQVRTSGIDEFGAYLESRPDFVTLCMQQIVVRDVNRETVRMFGAESKQQLLANLDRVLRDGMAHHFQDELRALWHGEASWSGEGVNYALDGSVLDILLHWRILPGHEATWDRVLVTIENITERKRAEQRLRHLFEASPISLWEEDYREIKAFFDDLRTHGVTELRTYLDANPDAVDRCMGLIRVLDVNQKTVELFGATSKAHLLANLPRIFRADMRDHFAQELLDLWEGRLAYAREGINYALSGAPVNVQLNLRVMPGHEDDFAWVLVALQDITARKRAEEYLYYLGTHDILTGLHNRAYFQETLRRVATDRDDPITLLVADLNDLKETNDSLGHAAGDNLIRRAAEVLKASFAAETVVARVGGDEFVAILPGVTATAAQELADRIRTLVALNNKYYRGAPLSIALGSATSRPGQELEAVLRQADDAMYRDKATSAHRSRTNPHR